MSNVHHPAHYNAGKIEVIEFLEDQFMDRPHEWNAVKYLARADKKGREVEDLQKAIWYIERKLELLRVKGTGAAPVRPNDMNPMFASTNQPTPNAYDGGGMISGSAAREQ